jgi:DNA-binding CsgD family transcriptional regulator
LGKLPYGSYTFVVRAKVGNKITENEASYSFVIKKPWYFTHVAIAFYIIGFFLIMGLIHRSYLRYYRHQRNKLILDNEKNLELTKLENERKIMMMRNEQLETELSSKNSELATTAMSLIKKNELLLEIKKDLSQLKDESSKVAVIKVIDKNLRNNNDWDFFKEAFNNADKDFLNKIKNLHPDLTANDLKFCAFLRLNLSSKEIAPLLNISVRSVEIKRYRLRKKLKLDHSDNLIDYILEI